MKKTNKTFKRFAAITSASLLAACAVAPVFTFAAEDAPKVDITVNLSGTENAAATSTFKAYRILDASISGTNYSYFVNDTFRGVLQTVTGKTTDDEIKNYIDALDATGTAEEQAVAIRAFADNVYANIGAIDATATSSNGVFDDLEQGYYLIVETEKGSDTDTISLVMLDTAGETKLEVETKEALPTFEKKIMDDNETGSETDENHNGVWRDSADYNIGDDVPFQLTATLPSDYASYKQYKLVFHDDLRDKETNVEVYSIPTSFTVYYDADNDNVCDENEALTFSTSTPTDSCDFEIVIDNLKTHAAAAAGGKVKVEYTAELLNTANIGAAGNWNDAKLSYSNNPYYTGTGDTLSKTPEQTVVAFTYQVNINKIDGANNKPLEGAGFTLYKKNAAGIYVQVGEEITGKTTFEFKGLDDGDYKISETTVPKDYNGAEDLEFTITAGHVNKTLGEITGTNLTVTEENRAIFETDIINNSGTTLPGTGGIGTTIFYLGGGAMAAIGGVYLISKRRMKKSEE